MSPKFIECQMVENTGAGVSAEGEPETATGTAALPYVFRTDGQLRAVAALLHEALALVDNQSPKCAACDEAIAKHKPGCVVARAMDAWAKLTP